MVKKTTCFKNPAKPICIDLIITNKPGMFQNSKTYETALSDFHKLVVSIMKLIYKKDSQAWSSIENFSNEYFKNSMIENFANNTELDYNSFEEIILNVLSSQAPLKKE